MNFINGYKIMRLMDFLLKKTKETDQEFYPAMIMVFLYVANRSKEDVLLNELPQALDLTQATVQRAIGALGEGTSRKRETGGLEYIQVRRHPIDHRRRLITLTPAGRAFLKELLASIEGISLEAASVQQ